MSYNKSASSAFIHAETIPLTPLFHPFSGAQGLQEPPQADREEFSLLRIRLLHTSLGQVFHDRHGNEPYDGHRRRHAGALHARPVQGVWPLPFS